MKRALCALLLLCALVLQPLARLFWTSRSPLSSKRTAILQQPSSTNCNVFEGDWVLDHKAHYPLYTPGACPFIDDTFSCSANGRPDSNFTRWSWRPRACLIPRFTGRDMLEGLRGKRVVFVGDSLSRNQWESMVCLLSQALPNSSSVLEVNGLQVTKERGAFDFLFEDYNCHLEYYNSHFLVEEESNTTTRRKQLRLDSLHKSHSHWSEADVLVFTTGHWWTYGKTARGGGKWNTGGECQSAVLPIVDESQIPQYPEKMLAIEHTLRHMKFPVKLLNITGLSSYRGDGHPSIYGLKNEHGYQDCSHWCLPGIPDVWNELLYLLLITDPKTYF